MSKANGDDYRHISPGQLLSEDRQRRRKVYACFSGDKSGNRLHTFLRLPLLLTFSVF